jgi:hypothetical protein
MKKIFINLFLFSILILISYLIYKFFIYIISFILIFILSLIYSVRSVVKHIEKNKEFITTLLNLNRNNKEKDIIDLLISYSKNNFKYNILARKILFQSLYKEIEKSKEYTTFDFIFALKIFNIQEENFEKMSINDIKKIYKILAKKNHPDLNLNSSDEKMKEINKAKEILINLKNK